MASDDLYSAGDSDNESQTDPFSPSDGYFHERQEQPLVEDPSPAGDESRKAREAREDAEDGTHAEPSHHQRTTSNFSTTMSSTESRPATQSHLSSTSPARSSFSPYNEESFSENSRLLPAAPPAYSPPASDSHIGASTGGNSAASGYGSVPNFLGRERDPESMGGAQHEEYDDEEGESRWARLKDTLRSCFSLRSICRVLLVIVAIAIGVGFIVDAVLTLVPEKVLSLRSHPEEELVLTTSQDQPVYRSPNDPKHILIPPMKCPSAIYGSKMNFKFDSPKYFEFAQLLSSRDGDKKAHLQTINTKGEVTLKAGSESMDSNIAVDLEIHYSDEELSHQHSVIKDDYGLIVQTPEYVLNPKERTSEPPCVFVKGVIWVKPGIELHHIDIEGLSIDLVVDDDVDLRVTDTARFASTAGDIIFHTSPAINSRVIRIETFSGSVSGNYPLYDFLGIFTLSGSVQIGVIPKPVDENAPKPANFKIDTSSGSITTSFPTNALPERDYLTKITSRSGGIYGAYLHGSQTKLYSVSGSINVSILPVGDSHSSSELITNSRSGSHDVRVLSPYHKGSKQLSNLCATHDHSSGSMELNYPADYLGNIAVRTFSGSVTIKGPEVALYKDGRSSDGHREVLARNGYKGDSEMKIVGASGSVDLSFASRWPESDWPFAGYLDGLIPIEVKKDE